MAAAPPPADHIQLLVKSLDSRVTRVLVSRKVPRASS
jgi:hypothetical protein